MAMKFSNNNFNLNVDLKELEVIIKATTFIAFIIAVVFLLYTGKLEEPSNIDYSSSQGSTISIIWK